ncbi:ABC transporter permease [Larkinella soli]|uniref:ABC transporter permease n=1 Tax=Larkinella soli TaxID=1770527 RepID=UPI001E631F64|nr:ABC transporter permease [Larkinella soli]
MKKNDSSVPGGSPKPTRPPRWADRLLRGFVAPHLLEYVQGDLLEVFHKRVRAVGPARARFEYVWGVLHCLTPFFFRRSPADRPLRPAYGLDYQNPAMTDMLRNYLKIAGRNLLRYRLNSTLTISGLALGLACALLMILHVKHELSYDRGFSKADRIYRITAENLGQTTRAWAATSPILGVEMQRQIPGIERVARFHRPYPDRVLSYRPTGGASRQFEEKGGFFADSTVVDVFDLVFVRGDPQTALSRTNAIVLTEAMARKYFGHEEPLGRVLQDDLDKRPLTVTGVIREFPAPAHLRFDYLISLSTWSAATDRETQQSRGWAGFYNYILLNEHTSRAAVESRIPGFMVKFYEAKGETRKEILANRRLPLQPITDIHLRSKLEKEMGPNSDITYVYVFSISALFILLIASVNFINMATAQAFTRMKEVGVRKALGARRVQLFKQFLGESFLLTLVSTLLALALFRMALPMYNTLTDKQLRFEVLFTPTNVALMVLLTASISLVAGLYPAWFVAGFDPVHSLKGRKNAAPSVALVRKGLIVFQFAVSVFMLFGTIVVYRQMRFFQSKDLGFNREQVVAVKLYGPDMQKNLNTLEQEFRKNAAIVGVARTSTLPGDRFGTDMLTLPGRSEPASQLRFMWTDEQALPLLQVGLKAGRYFFPKAEGAPMSVILNEAAVKDLRLTSPIGQKILTQGVQGEVVGVVENFHFASLHTAVEPLVIVYYPNAANYFLLRIKGDQLARTLEFARSALARVVPGSVFSHTFLDEKLDRLYEAEQRTGQVLNVFAGFAVLISCLGLFGLSAYTAQLRTKEVGIRKTLGASVPGIAVLLSKDFLQLVVVAILIASPLAWWAMSRWLNGFAYRIDLEWWMFVLAGTGAVAVAVLTVSFQSIRTALTNPVKSLRAE